MDMTAIEKITKSKEVSRYVSDVVSEHDAGLKIMAKVRMTYRNYRRSLANQKEDMPHAAAFEREHGRGSAHDAGLWATPQRPKSEYVRLRFTEALAAGLPAELDKLVRAFLAAFAHAPDSPPVQLR